MPFNAIVHAPSLRVGARLNIAMADQEANEAPNAITPGAELRIRFGVCCPDLALGRIVDMARQPERATLAVGNGQGTLIRGGSGVSTPGLVSEDWFVAPPCADL